MDLGSHPPAGGLGLFAGWLKIPRAVSGQAPLCERFLSLSLPDLPKQVNDQVQGQRGRAGKDLGCIFCSPPQAAWQVSPPSLARTSTGTDFPMETQSQATHLSRLWASAGQHRIGLLSPAPGPSTGRPCRRSSRSAWEGIDRTSFLAPRWAAR